MASVERRQILLVYDADISKLNAELKKAPEKAAEEFERITEAADEAATSIERAATSSREAADEGLKKLSDGGKQAKGALDDVAEGGGDAERSLLGLADLLEVVGLDAAATGVRLGADLGGGLEGVLKGGRALLSGLGPVAAVLSVVAVAAAAGVTVYSFYANAESEAEEEARILEASLANLETQLVGLTEKGIKEANKSWAKFIDSARAVQTELDIINGVTTEAQAQGEERIRQIEEQSHAALLASGQEVAAIQRKLDAATAAAEAETVNALEAGQYTVIVARLARELDAATAALDEKKAALDDVRESVRMLVDYEDVQAESEERLEAREKDRVIALQRQREALQATAQLTQIATAAQAAQLDGYAAVNFQMGLQLAKIDELTAKGGDLAAADAARAAVAAQAAHATTELGTALATEMDQARLELEGVAEELERMAEKAEAVLQEQIRGAVAGTVSDVAGAVTSLVGEALNQQLAAVASTQAALQALGEDASAAERQRLLAQLEEEKAAGLQLFKANKAASISSAIINGALAVIQCFAQLGPVAGAIAAVGVGATVGAQIGIIGAQPPPSYHQGLSNDPSEYLAQLRFGERVLTAQGSAAVGGDKVVAAANRGQPQGTGPMVIRVALGARTAAQLVVAGTGTTGQARLQSRSQRPRGRTHHYPRGG